MSADPRAELPTELIDGLTYLRQLAALPGLKAYQARSVRRATGRLLIAGAAAGWRLEAMGRVLGADWPFGSTEAIDTTTPAGALCSAD